MITLNGIKLPSPSSLGVTNLDLQSSAETTASGQTIVNRIGKALKVELEWKFIPSVSQYNNLYRILDNLKPSRNMLTFPAPNGSIMTISCIRSDVGTGMYSYVNGVGVWENLKVTFTEDVTRKY